MLLTAVWLAGMRMAGRCLTSKLLVVLGASAEFLDTFASETPLHVDITMLGFLYVVGRL
jgi:hypothetical protein